MTLGIIPAMTPFKEYRKMKRFFRITITDKGNVLTYKRRGLFLSIPINGNLVDAKYVLKRAINRARSSISNYRDKLPINSGRILNLLRRKQIERADECFESKKPVNRSKHIGVEIEFLSPSSQRDISLSLAKAGLTQYVELKTDGSVSDNNDNNNCDGSCRDNCECADCGETHYCDDETDCNRRIRNYGSHGNESWEYRADCTDCTDTEYREDCDCGGRDDSGNPTCNGEHVVCIGHCPGHYCNGYDDHTDYDCTCECNCNSDNEGHEIAIVATAKKIPEIISKVCAVLAQHDAFVNDTCGLHVHLDMRGRDEKRAFGNLVKAQKLFFAMLPRSRFRSSYCKPNTCLEMEKHSGRYWAINPQSYEEHHTIEVRCHSGTVNAEKINNWIALLSSIAYGKSVTQIDSLKDLPLAIRKKKPLMEYISARVEKFKSAHVSDNLIAA
jgi:hypothetical protein